MKLDRLFQHVLALGIAASTFTLNCGGDDTPASTVPVPTVSAPTVPAPAPVPIPVPLNLRVSASGRDFAEWSWDALEGAGGYHAQFSPDAVFTDQDEIIVRTAEQLSYRRDALEPDTTAYLRVRSMVLGRDQPITSAWSAPVAAATEPALPGLWVAATRLALTEGETTTLAVRLATRPMAPVTVAASIQAPEELFRPWPLPKGPPLLILRGERLTFDPASWKLEQSVTLFAPHDADSEDEQPSLYLDVTSDDVAYEQAPRRVLPIEVTDDDPAMLVVRVFGHGLYGPSDGVTRVYGAALTSPPSDDVRVTITSHDEGIVAVTYGDRLLFPLADHDAVKTFALTGVPGRPHDVGRILIEASGGGYDFFSERFLLPPVVEGASDDPLEFSLETVALTEGAESRFSIRLVAAPEGDIRVRIQNYTLTSLSIVDGNTEPRCWHSSWGTYCYEIHEKIVFFSPDDWDLWQDVHLVALEDDDSRDTATAVVFEAQEAPGIGRFRGGGQVLRVTIRDDDFRP